MDIDSAMELMELKFGEKTVAPKLRPKKGNGDIRKKVREGAVVAGSAVRKAARDKEKEQGYNFQDELNACAKAQVRYREVEGEIGEVVWENKELVAMHRAQGSVC